MSTARNNFIERIKNIQQSLSIDALIDKSPSDINHNNIAKILRNGLAVVGFVALEDFIKNRSREVLDEISSSSITFNELPEKIRLFSTVELLNTLNRLVRNESDKIAFIQDHSKKISSTLLHPFSLSEFTFGYKGSNIQTEEIKEILGAFLIKDAWRNMTKISSRIGLTGFPLDNSFKNAADRRHTAAHSPNANTPFLDLNQYTSEAIGIAIGFDCLLSKALHYIKLKNQNYLNNTLIIDETLISFSSIKFNNGKWIYKRDALNRNSKSNSDKQSVITASQRSAQRHNETLIIYNEINNIESWTCY